MRRWARLDGGVVSEFFDTDPEGIHNSTIVASCVVCDDDTALPGATWDGVQFTNDPAVVAAVAKRIKDRDDAAATKGDAALRALVNMSPAEIETWVDNNVTTLAGARVAVKLLGKAVALLARRQVGG